MNIFDSGVRQISEGDALAGGVGVVHSDSSEAVLLIDEDHPLSVLEDLEGIRGS